MGKIFSILGEVTIPVVEDLSSTYVRLVVEEGRRFQREAGSVGGDRRARMPLTDRFKMTLTDDQEGVPTQ
jgi:hypothetical protein